MTSLTRRPIIWQLDLNSHTQPVSCPFAASDTKQPLKVQLQCKLLAWGRI